VSAYLSNNPTQASDIPNLISQVHAALLRVSTGRNDPPLERPARGVDQEVDHARISGVPRRRQTLQIAQAPSAHAIQHDAGAISRQMGLPADYPMVAPNYAVRGSQLAKKMGLGQQARKKK